MGIKFVYCNITVNCKLVLSNWILIILSINCTGSPQDHSRAKLQIVYNCLSPLTLVCFEIETVTFDLGVFLDKCYSDLDLGVFLDCHCQL